MKDELTRVSSGESDPSCLECNGILKSDTISFGQSLDETKIAMAFDYVKNSDLLLCVGTTLQVFPIAGAVDVAKAASAQLIIVNNQATQSRVRADPVQAPRLERGDEARARGREARRAAAEDEGRDGRRGVGQGGGAGRGARPREVEPGRGDDGARGQGGFEGGGRGRFEGFGGRFEGGGPLSLSLSLFLSV